MGPTPLRGLSEQEAASRLAGEGANELPGPKRRLRRIMLGILREPMFALLLGAGRDLSRARRPRGGAGPARLFAMHLGVDRHRPGEPGPSGCSKPARPDQPARAGDPRRARRRIAGREVVRGDIVILAEGDRVPADAIAALGARSAGRRIAADRRIRAGAQAGPAGGSRRRRGPAATICHSSIPAP